MSGLSKQPKKESMLAIKMEEFLSMRLRIGNLCVLWISINLLFRQLMLMKMILKWSQQVLMETFLFGIYFLKSHKKCTFLLKKENPPTPMVSHKLFIATSSSITNQSMLSCRWVRMVSSSYGMLIPFFVWTQYLHKLHKLFQWFIMKKKNSSTLVPTGKTFQF